jgi:hypothetical protein
MLANSTKCKASPWFNARKYSKPLRDRKEKRLPSIVMGRKG